MLRFISSVNKLSSAMDITSLIESAKQLTRQYREWNNARSKLKGELKCNRCKNYFPRDLITRVYTGNGRWWNAYCDECLVKRNPRMARRRYEEAT